MVYRTPPFSTSREGQGARENVPAEAAFTSAASALLRSLSASASSARSLNFCSGSASRFPWFATNNVAFPDAHLRAYICVGKKDDKNRHYTVGFLRDIALFGEREEDLLRGCFGDGSFKVGGDVYGTVRAVYLMVVRMVRNVE
jgi:hypothetical protein